MRRWLIRAFAVAALTLLLMKLFGSVSFTPPMSEHLLRVATRLGVRGDEAVEDLYLTITAVISLAASMAVVGGMSLFTRRRSNWRRSLDGSAGFLDR